MSRRPAAGDPAQELEWRSETLRDLRQLHRQIQWALRIAVALVTFGIAVFLWAGFSFGDSAEDLQRFGTFVGGTTGVIWALAGVVLIYIAFLGQQQQVLNQQEELRLSRVEVRETRKEVQAQRKQLEQQTQTFLTQQFDSTFFQLVRLHHDIVEATTFRFSGGAVTGRPGFDLAYDELRALYHNHKDTLTITELAEIPYRELYRRFQAQLGHYFRNLYHIVKFVDANDDQERRRYIGILRAQLSSNELLLLFYNGLSHAGRQKFLPLIETYALLKAMPREELLHPAHEGLYAPTAYGDVA